MLKSSDKSKIEKYVQKIFDELLRETNESIESGTDSKHVFDEVTQATVNKVTAESKMLMSSIYNMMKDDTLSEAIFQKAENKAAFYQDDILKELNSQFSFEVPNRIDYKESKKVLDKWITGGSVVVVAAGGVISIKFKSILPLGISLAIAFAAIMGLILYNKSNDNRKSSNDTVISEYLNGVKESLLAWIDTIEKYYDSRVCDIKKGLNE